MVKRIMRRVIRAARTWRHKGPPPDLTRYGIGEHNYDWVRAAFDAVRRDPECAVRPAYIWGMLQGAGLAHTLQIPTVSALEFGVANGRGLLALERIATKVREISGIRVDVVGFDTGTGLPSPIDHRDVPNLLWTGRFPMDPAALQKRLTTASIVLGPIAKTLGTYLEGRPPPVAFISVDVDLYSSTVDCLCLFEADSSLLLPRVYCYFDDILGYTYSDCNGELLAIAEFNANHPLRQVCKIHGLKFYVHNQAREEQWVECFYIAHIFEHERYAQRSSTVTPAHDQRITRLR